MTSKAVLFGIIGGVALAVALASLFSTGAATAQMMSMPNQQMTQHQQMQSPYQGMKQSMFSASGMSMIQDVRITGVSITGDNEITVSMTYGGNGTSPSVTVVGMTNHRGMMDMMVGGGMGGMVNPGMTSMNSMGAMTTNMTNSTQHGMIQMQSGSSTLDAGWESGDEVTITLDGDASAYDAADVHVMVFPHIT